MGKPTYRQFLKTDVDLSPLGIFRTEAFEPYFCTPKGARVFGRSGVDGIHFCFVRGFGETVFAVSPMNGRENCVHPVAKSFRDFLRLLLALHDAAAIEQAWQWNAAQLEDFEQKHPSNEEQKAALACLAQTFELRPMAEPWKYIHTVQTGFDYGKLRFSEEFYDEAAPDMQDAPWRVSFEGGFWGEHGTPGKEFSVNAEFFWAGERWLVPAAYLCEEGVVLDLCRQIPVEKIFRFREKWRLSPQNDGSDFSEDKFMACQAENPYAQDISAELLVNGEALSESHGYGLCWEPLYTQRNESDAKRVQAHYGLDDRSGWYVQRVCFAWKTAKQDEIKTLALRLAAQPVCLPGEKISPRRAGDCVRLQRPGDETKYTLLVTQLDVEELSYFGVPLYTTVLQYDVSPELPGDALTLRDAGRQESFSDLVSKSGELPGASVGIIGGADGPTALVLGGKGVCSHVRREREKPVTWQVIFRQKQKEDLMAELLPRGKEQMV